MRVLAHDPFTRVETVRRTETSDYPHLSYVKAYECAWCGHVRRTKSGKATTFRYGTHHDGITTRIQWDDRVFCSKSCRDAFSC